MRAVVVLDTRFDAQLISHLIDQSFVKKDNNAVILSLERVFSRKICLFSNLIVNLKEAVWLIIVAYFLFTEGQKIAQKESGGHTGRGNETVVWCLVVD